MQRDAVETAALAELSGERSSSVSRNEVELNRQRNLWSWREELNLQPAV